MTFLDQLWPQVQLPNYRFTYRVEFRVNGTTKESVYFDGGYIRANGGANENQVSFSTIIDLNDGDYVEVLVTDIGGLSPGDAVTVSGTNLSVKYLQAVGASGGGGGSDGVATAGSYDVVNQEIDVTVTGASDFSIPMADYITPFVFYQATNQTNSVNINSSAVFDMGPDIDKVISNYGPGNDTIAYSNGVCTVPFDGLYEITYYVNFQKSGSTANMSLGVTKNGSGSGNLLPYSPRRAQSSTQPGDFGYTTQVVLNDGDTVRPVGFFTSTVTGGCTLSASSDDCIFSVKLLRKL